MNLILLQSCTGIEDSEKAEKYLSNAQWDLLVSIWTRSDILILLDYLIPSNTITESCRISYTA